MHVSEVSPPIKTILRKCITVSKLIVPQKFEFDFFSKNTFWGIVRILHFMTFYNRFLEMFFPNVDKYNFFGTINSKTVIPRPLRATATPPQPPLDSFLLDPVQHCTQELPVVKIEFPIVRIPPNSLTKRDSTS